MKNELITIVKNKLQKEIVIQDLKIEDKSFLHKNHKYNQEGRFHLKLTIKSDELVKLNKRIRMRVRGKDSYTHIIP